MTSVSLKKNKGILTLEENENTTEQKHLDKGISLGGGFGFWLCELCSVPKEAGQKCGVFFHQVI